MPSLLVVDDEQSICWGLSKMGESLGYRVTTASSAEAALELAAEAGPNDPAIQRALLFVSRCQNLDSQQNNTRFAALVKDGGFYYDIPLEDIDPQQSPERFTENGGLRSYGSMTYTGLKSMIFAGLTKDDPRVKAAVEWITNYYATDKNPGMGNAGLYYYYHTFGAALNAAGIDQLTDAQGQKHDWRGELIEALARRQQPDGSWANENRRWFENDKNLATSFACGTRWAASKRWRGSCESIGRGTMGNSPRWIRSWLTRWETPPRWSC